jgi:hypothetical protein
MNNVEPVAREGAWRARRERRLDTRWRARRERRLDTRWRAAGRRTSGIRAALLRGSMRQR